MKMKKPQISAWNDMNLDVLDINPSEGVRFTLEDGSWVEMSWRSGDQTLSISGSGQLILSPIASNVCRVGAAR